jgi:DNA-binding MarR family transcriptional regulator
MDASRVTITNDTINRTKLTPRRARALRERKIVEYIQSLPYGRIVTLNDIRELLGVSLGTASGLMSRLIARGRLVRESVVTNGRSCYTYTVASPVTVRKLEPEPKTSAPLAPPPVVPAKVEASDLTTELIRQLQALGVDFKIVIESKPSDTNDKE